MHGTTAAAVRLERYLAEQRLGVREPGLRERGVPGRMLSQRQAVFRERRADLLVERSMGVANCMFFGNAAVHGCWDLWGAIELPRARQHVRPSQQRELLHEPARDGWDVQAQLRQRDVHQWQLPGDRERLPAGQVRGHGRSVPEVRGGVGRRLASCAGGGKHTHLNGGSGLVDSGTGTTYEPGWSTSWATNLATTNATWSDTSHLACDSTYQTWTPTAGSNERRPVNCMDWYDAARVLHLGRRLSA